MITWHITIRFQAPRGAVVTDETVTSIHEAIPEFTWVSHLSDNQLEFAADAAYGSSTDLYAKAYRKAANAATDVLGYPVEFIRGEVVRHDVWLEQIDPGGAVRAWVEGESDPATSG